MTGIQTEDYVEGQEPNMNDATAPFEEVDRKFMDKLAKLVTKFEEVLDVGNGDLRLGDLHKYIEARGNALDLMDDPELTAWLDHMRQTARCPFRKFAISG